MIPAGGVGASSQGPDGVLSLGTSSQGPDIKESIASCLAPGYWPLVSGLWPLAPHFPLKIFIPDKNQLFLFFPIWDFHLIAFYGFWKKRQAFVCCRTSAGMKSDAIGVSGP
jgi:hypothetical protein